MAMRGIMPKASTNQQVGGKPETAPYKRGGKLDLGITDASKKLYRTLLKAEKSVPQDTLFRKDLFDETCESI